MMSNRQNFIGIAVFFNSEHFTPLIFSSFGLQVARDIGPHLPPGLFVFAHLCDGGEPRCAY